MRYQAQYNAKKCSPERAISIIRNEDAVLSAGDPGVLLGALYDARENFSDLRIFSVFGISSKEGTKLYKQDAVGHIRVVSMVLNQDASAANSYGSVDQVIINMSEAESYIENHFRPTILLAQSPPPDENGYFYPGIDGGCASAAVGIGAKVIVQVNEKLPLIYSDDYRIHVNSVTAIVEGNEVISGVEICEPSAVDMEIAGFVAELIPDTATIQLGAGILTNAVGRSLNHHKDLGIHTDCFNSALVELIRNGAVNNSKKEVMKGKSVGGYFSVPENDVEYIHKNPDVMLKKLSWICNHAVIRQMDRFMSVNTGLAVDFRGQICSCNMGMSCSGGIGAHLDFARGAKWSTGGKSFIVMRSATCDANGALKSCILPTLPDGSLVSIPRSDIMYVVTEYGAADLHDKSVKERVKALISIAHPEFREWLMDEARIHKFI